MAKIGAKVLGIQVPIGAYEYPLITTNLPVSMEVGDLVNFTATVKRADNVTLIQGISIDFFVKDSTGTISLGTASTDINGQATSPKDYLISETEQNTNIEFYVQVKGKKL